MSERDMFEAALELPAGDRAGFLNDACAGEAALRQRLQALLSKHDQAGSFLEEPAVTGACSRHAPRDELLAADAGPADRGQKADAVGQVLAGRYKLLEEIGEGGMGTVWLAQQIEAVKRLVAIKLIKPGMDSKQVLARFEAERQVLALMDHPNIAKVLDAGTITVGWAESSRPTIGGADKPVGLEDSAHPTLGTGRPFFVMELVKGIPITDCCDQCSLTTRERLEQFLAVCQAVQHAHQKGVIHRDIKPSNVLVAIQDGKPVVKVIDFGVAKAINQRLSEHTLLTGFHQMIGTPLYMSPEQAEMSPLDVDTRADIYSLGVLLYELLTGTTPFEKERLSKASYDELRRIIREEEPPRPSARLSTLQDQLTTVATRRRTQPRQLLRTIRGELDWIVMKALEKDRGRRYETANSFAADVQRYLNDEPVQACPPSTGYRLKKFVRRNKVGLAVAGLIVLFLVILGSGLGWIVADRAVRQAALMQEVSRALEETEGWYKRDNVPEAMAAVKRAEALLLTGGGSGELGQRVRQWSKDLQIVVRLEEIMLEKGAMKDEDFDWGGADAAYHEVFRSYGLDVESPGANDVAERIRTSSIKDRLVAGLDDWELTRNLARLPGCEALLGLARRVDDDSWRDQVRQALMRRDLKALEILARNQQVVQQPPSSVMTLAACLAGDKKTLPLSVQVLKQAQQRYPGDFWINHAVAFNLRQLRPPQAAEAITFARVALALRPQHAGMHFNVGIALNEHGKLDEAVAAYLRAIKLKPDFADAHYSLGNTLSSQEKAEEAAAAYRKAIELKPDYAPAHVGLGMALFKQGQVDEAIAAYHKAIALKAAYAPAYSFLGLALNRQGKRDDAVAACLKAVAMDPKDARAYFNLGNVLEAQGKLDKAAAAYRNAIERNPDYAIAHMNLGNVLSAQDKLDEASAAHRKAIKLKPDHALAHYNLGHTLQQQRKLDEAIAAYRKAIELQPDFAMAHCNLGLALRDQGEFAEGLTYLKRGHQLGSRDSRWSFPSAKWVKSCEQLLALEKRLPEVLVGNPANRAEQLKLADLCLRYKQRYGDAALLYGKALAAEPKLGDDLGKAHRYNAACAAVLTASGKGAGAEKLDTTEKARLRRQALNWLQADLAGRANLLAKDPATAAAIRKELQHWLDDVDLSSVRDAMKLNDLPREEREAWMKLWSDVRAQKV